MSQPLKTSIDTYMWWGEGGKLINFIDNNTYLTVILVIRIQGSCNMATLQTHNKWP